MMSCVVGSLQDAAVLIHGAFNSAVCMHVKQIFEYLTFTRVTFQYVYVFAHCSQTKTIFLDKLRGATQQQPQVGNEASIA